MIFMVRIIEFVCTANHGRSPVAALIAQNYIEDHNLADYEVISSGSRANEWHDIKAGKLPIPVRDAKSFVGLGRKAGFFSELSGQSIDDVLAREDLTPSDLDFLRDMASRAFQSFEKDEGEFRDRAVRELGLRGTLKQTQDQLVAGDNRVLILGMGQNHVARIMELYQQSRVAGRNYRSAEIDTLAGYSDGNSGAEFHSAYGESFENYMTMIGEIRRYVRGSMDRLVSPNLIW